MPCVKCNRPAKVTPLVTLEQGEAFLCWYCRASRVASSLAHLLEVLNKDETLPGELDEAVELAEKELEPFYYSGMSPKELKKPIKGLEDDQ